MGAESSARAAGKGIGGLDAGVFFYYVAFALYAFGVVMATTAAEISGYAFVGRLMVYLKFLAFLLLGFKIALFQRQSVSQLAVVALAVLLGLVSYVVTDEPTVLALALFVGAARGVDYRVLAGIVLVVNLLVLALAMLFCFCGVFVDYVMLRSGTDGVRHSLGFSHPNYFGFTVVAACSAFFVLRGERIGFIDAVIAAFGCSVVLVVSDSRTAAVGIALALVLFFCSAHLRCNASRRVLFLTLLFAVALAVAVSLYCMVFFDASQPFMKALNDLVTSRFSLAHGYFLNYPPGILGQNTDLIPLSYYSDGQIATHFFVDNAFCRLYLRYGPITLILLLFALTAFLAASARRGYAGIVFVGIAFAAIYGVSEHMFIRPDFNFFLVVGLSWLLYGFPEGAEYPSRERTRSARRRAGWAISLSLPAGVSGRRI